MSVNVEAEIFVYRKFQILLLAVTEGWSRHLNFIT